MPIEAADLAKDPTIVALQNSVKGLTTLLTQQGNSQRQIMDAITKLSTPPTEPTKGKKGKSKAKDDDDDDDADEDADLDSMSQSQFAKFLIKQVGGLIEDKVKPLGEELSQFGTQFRTKEVREQISSLKGKVKDFDDWSEEIGALAKIHKSLNVRQLYALARDNDPEKAKELDGKYNKKEPTKRDDEVLSLFGGMRPSTKLDADGKEVKPEKMTMDQALEASWSEALEKVPSLGKVEDVMD